MDFSQDFTLLVGWRWSARQVDAKLYWIMKTQADSDTDFSFMKWQQTHKLLFRENCALLGENYSEFSYAVQSEIQ